MPVKGACGHHYKLTHMTKPGPTIYHGSAGRLLRTESVVPSQEGNSPIPRAINSSVLSAVTNRVG